ncbi:MAG TPA: hypothetical protein VGV85_03095 [Longimicrobiaceae bacterium]|nr:hypothetical protein [Longimicrobiaceae bacterium]
MRRPAPIAAALALALAACDTGPVLPGGAAAPDAALGARQPASTATTTSTHFTTTFTATALCGAPIGDIRFSGVIQGVDHTTVDGNGETHRTRQFRVKGLSGWTLPETVFNAATADYRVIGGAEMLTWNTQIGQVPGVPGRSIHAGTLVFEPIGGGDRVVAHHAIRYVENAKGEMVVDFHAWSCR